MPLAVDSLPRRARTLLPFAAIAILLPVLTHAQQDTERENDAEAEASLPEETGPGDEASLVLDEITITAAGTVTEGTDSWTADWSRTATGMVLTQKETPQSTSIVTNQFLKDQNLTNLTEVMEASTGITVQKYDSERTQFFSRGFEITSYQYDGVPTSLNTVWAWGDSETDMAIYDHVEVVRGATGLMTGAGEPGASVNFIRKRPTLEFQGALSSQVGTEGLARVEGDIAGPITKDGRIRGRAIAAAQTGGNGQDLWWQDRWIGYGIVEADVGDATTLSIGANYQDNDPKGTTWAGLPAYDSAGDLIDWQRGATTAAEWTSWQTEITEIFGSVEHVFDNGWTGRVALNHLENDFDAKLLFMSGLPDPVTGLGLSAFPAYYTGNRKQDTGNAQINGDFEAFGRLHQFVVGAFASDARSTADYYDADVVPPVGNIWDWDGSYPEPDWVPSGNTDTDSVRQYALYATGDFELDDGLHVIAGARLNYWKGETASSTTSFAYEYSGEITPYLGVTYDISPTYTAYASYTSIYQPQIVQDVAGNYLTPTYGANYEAGIKATFADDRVNASVAVFQTDQKDVAEFLYWIEEEQRSVYRLIDGTKTRGFEVEVAGEVMDGWNVFGGYTYRYSTDDDGEEIYTNQPRSTLKLSSTYDLPGKWSNLTIGGGVRWQSQTSSLTTVDFTIDNVVQDPYAVVDAMARYRINDTAAITFNVTNLFDEKYYQTTGFYDSVVYGEGRLATLGLTAAF